MPRNPANASRNVPVQRERRPTGRSRSNTARSFGGERYNIYEEPPMPVPDPEPVRQYIRSQTRVPAPSRLETPIDTRTRDEYSSSPSRPNIGRATTFQGPTTIYRESPTSNRQNSIPNELALRGQLRQTNRINTGTDLFGDPSDESTINSASPDRSYGARSVSPATSHESSENRTATGKKAPPPPPPSRAKKPPPPPPMKRADISSSGINRS
jgi:hypothetical protein